MVERYLLSGSAALKALEFFECVSAPENFAKPTTLMDHVSLVERQLIVDAVRRHHGDMRAVMEELGIPRRTLNEKMTKYGMSRVAILSKD